MNKYPSKSYLLTIHNHPIHSIWHKICSWDSVVKLCTSQMCNQRQKIWQLCLGYVLYAKSVKCQTS